MTFNFATDSKSHRFCEGIVRAMILLYDVSPDKALVIINASWQGQKFLGDSIIYHETEWYWADVLANPNPYLDAEDPDQLAWKRRDDEARNRLAELE